MQFSDKLKSFNENWNMAKESTEIVFSRQNLIMTQIRRQMNNVAWVTSTSLYSSCE
jgi:hypothetical protein